ncbi:DUF3179 domain-containing protein [Synechocystis salina LEGE 06155]|nr:DUF3179 domain-containing protein [Synechocystis salina LEGE 06155]
MNNIRLLGIGLGTLSILVLGTIFLKAEGFDDLKLRYSFLTKHFSDQSLELVDSGNRNTNSVQNNRIDLTEILSGGPPPEGIPSIDRPQFDTAADTPFNREEVVIGLVVNGEARAYPLGIMNWHEIVNDTVGGKNITVSYCPLCDTIVAFDRQKSTFGVSGKLYQSCLVMYDRQDGTLYAQPWGLGVVGEKVNQSLERVVTVKTTLGEWLKKHPDSQILSTNTGHTRDYFRYPYGSYTRNEELIFPVRHQDQLQLHPKAIVSYVWEADNQTPANQFSGASQQFAHDELKQAKEKVVPFGDRQIRARWDQELNTVIVEELDGTTIPSSTAFAFVYPGFFGES